MFGTQALFFITPRWQAGLLAMLCLSLLSACGSSPKITPQRDTDISGSAAKTQVLKQLYQHHSAWQGTPYRFGGESRSGIDCSAFVQITFHDLFGINLPRTTSQLIRVGHQINKSDLQAGDLVFFRNGSHVGIYLEDDQFLHASTRLGITISDMNNIYWSRKYWRSIRVRSQINTR